MYDHEKYEDQIGQPEEYLRYNTYQNEENSHSQRGSRRPGKRKINTRRRRAKIVRTLFFFTLSLAVLVSCTLSYIALTNARSAGKIPVAATTSQTAATSQATAGHTISTGGTDSSILLTDVSDIVKGAMPSVVSITSRSLISNYGYPDFFSRIMGGYGYGYGPMDQGEGQTEEVDSGIGSGTIVGTNDKELLILTSYHVVDGCSSLYVTFDDDASVDGYIKSAAEDKDIAIVAVPLADISEETKQHITIAKLCENGVEVGDGIVIIGDALGYGQSVITGIISATDREITAEGTTMKLLQTDAAINAGNSGGCMLNSNGEIVGISEAKITDASVEGMCYAIPIKENLALIHELMGVETVA